MKKVISIILASIVLSLHPRSAYSDKTLPLQQQTLLVTLDILSQQKKGHIVDMFRNHDTMPTISFQNIKIIFKLLNIAMP